MAARLGASRSALRSLAAFAAGAAAGFAALAGLALVVAGDAPNAQQAAAPSAALKAAFVRPTFVPHPPGDAHSAAASANRRFTAS